MHLALRGLPRQVAAPGHGDASVERRRKLDEDERAPPRHARDEPFVEAHRLLPENAILDGDTRITKGAEALAVRPRVGILHRRHHTKLGSDRNSNFGTIFAVWDRVFATYRASDSTRQIETGLAGLAGDVPLGRALMLPLQR